MNMSEVKQIDKNRGKMSRKFLFVIFLLVRFSECMRSSENGLYTDIIVRVDKDVVIEQDCRELKGNIQV